MPKSCLNLRVILYGFWDTWDIGGHNKNDELAKPVKR